MWEGFIGKCREQDWKLSDVYELWSVREELFHLVYDQCPIIIPITEKCWNFLFLFFSSWKSAMRLPIFGVLANLRFQLFRLIRSNFTLIFSFHGLFSSHFWKRFLRTGCFYCFPYSFCFIEKKKFLKEEPNNPLIFDEFSQNLLKIFLLLKISFILFIFISPIFLQILNQLFLSDKQTWKVGMILGLTYLLYEHIFG